MKKLTIELNKWARVELKRKSGQFVDNLPCGMSRMLNEEGAMCCLGHVASKLNNISDDVLKPEYGPTSVYNRPGTIWEENAMVLNDSGEHCYFPKKQRSKLIEHFKNRPEEEGGPIELEFVEE